MIDLGRVDIGELSEAISLVQFSDKPTAGNNQLTTAGISQTPKFMVQGQAVATSLGFGTVRKHIASILRPGQGCDFHIDPLVDGTAGRIHIPITTNDDCWLYYEDEKHHLEVGHAYHVFIDQMHRVYNGGTTFRIHYMFDYE